MYKVSSKVIAWTELDYRLEGNGATWGSVIGGAKANCLNKEKFAKCFIFLFWVVIYRGADKSLARPGRTQARTTEDFDVHISYL